MVKIRKKKVKTWVAIEKYISTQISFSFIEKDCFRKMKFVCFNIFSYKTSLYMYMHTHTHQTNIFKFYNYMNICAILGLIIF